LSNVQQVGELADIHKFSEQMIDFAERLSNVADAASGKRPATGRGTARWLLLPAAGAGLYALVRSELLTRQAKGAVNGAKTLASELPNDLLNTVRQTPPKSTSSGGSQRRSQTSSARKTKSAR
jgi:hypothetical protein